MNRRNGMGMLNEATIREAVGQTNAGPFGADIHYYPQVGSTNDILRDLADQGGLEGTLVITDEQVQGRGRMGRTWSAPAGTSLLMSLLFRPQLKPMDAHRLVMVAGLAAAQACESITGLQVDVKWPNDLQIKGKKLAGILPESAIEGSALKWVIIGMGINVNQRFPAQDPLAERATSLAAAGGQPVDRAELLAQIMSGIEAWNGRLRSTALSDAWRDRCTTLGKRVEIMTAQGVLVGIADNIDDNGALWLRTDNGQRHLLTLGEATIIAAA
jgi:BirA family transcriptional regulator, biotin operon repressor / biotin---[acetyl-CoA-carboxylase] ligase